MNAVTQNFSVIEPKQGWIPVNIRELWKFRELLYFLAWRDIKVKYSLIPKWVFEFFGFQKKLRSVFHEQEYFAAAKSGG